MHLCISYIIVFTKDCFLNLFVSGVRIDGFDVKYFLLFFNSLRLFFLFSDGLSSEFQRFSLDL